jgi:hypothetical protein
MDWERFENKRVLGSTETLSRNFLGGTAVPTCSAHVLLKYAYSLSRGKKRAKLSLCLTN